MPKLREMPSDVAFEVGLAKAEADVTAGRAPVADGAFYEPLKSGVRIGSTQAEAWRRENADALESSNAWFEANGLPLGRFRTTYG